MAKTNTKSVELYTGKRVMLYSGYGNGVTRLDCEGTKVWGHNPTDQVGTVYFVPLTLTGQYERPRLRYILVRVIIGKRSRRLVQGVRELNPHTGKLMDLVEGAERFYAARAAIALGLRKDDGRVVYDRIADHERERVAHIKVDSGTVEVRFKRLGAHWGNIIEVVESVKGPEGQIWSYREGVHEGRHFYLPRLGDGSESFPFFNAMLVETAGSADDEVVVDVRPLFADGAWPFMQVETTALYMEAAAHKLGVAVNDDPSIRPLAFAEPVDTTVKARPMAQPASPAEERTLH